MSSGSEHSDSHRPREFAGIRRLKTLGTLATGVLAFILAVNASLDSEYVGAGILLIAAALAFSQRGGFPGSRFRG